MNKAQALPVVLDLLQQTARAGQTIPDSYVAGRIGWAPRGIGPLLGEIAEAEAAAGRPLLSAVVVQKDSHRPGGGFFEMAKSLGRCHNASSANACWREELADAHAWWASQPS